MEQYIPYILEKDRQLIFHPKFERQVIERILEDTEGYQMMKNKNPSESPLPLEWVVREDTLLAHFSLQMFLRSKKILPADITHEEFIVLWANYTQTPDYFIQVANYMLNSDDYKLGARIQFQSETTGVSQFPEGNLVQNMKKLQNSFQGDPEKESRYVQKIARIGTEVFNMFQHSL